MVGRILTHLKATELLLESLVTRGHRHDRHPRPYAVRKPRELAIEQSGDLVQLDTMHLRPLPRVEHYHVIAVDMVSRHSAVGVMGSATAGTATAFLAELVERAPFPIRAIQVDGGSEFKAAFEAACQEQGIALYALPPRSPKLSGRVERVNGMHRRDFWECYANDLDLPAMQAALHAWEQEYNTLRPHQALVYQIPAAFLATLAPSALSHRT